MKSELIANVKRFIREAQVNFSMASDAFTGQAGFTDAEVKLFEDLQDVISKTGRMFLSNYDVLR